MTKKNDQKMSNQIWNEQKTSKTLAKNYQKNEQNMSNQI